MIKGYYYNTEHKTFFVDDINSPLRSDIVVRVALTRFPGVNNLMSRLFRRYRKRRMDQSIVQQAMKILEYDEEFEIFNYEPTIEDVQNKNLYKYGLGIPRTGSK